MLNVLMSLWYSQNFHACIKFLKLYAVFGHIIWKLGYGWNHLFEKNSFIFSIHEHQNHCSMRKCRQILSHVNFFVNVNLICYCCPKCLNFAIFINYLLPVLVGFVMHNCDDALFNFLCICSVWIFLLFPNTASVYFDGINVVTQ